MTSSRKVGILGTGVIILIAAFGFLLWPASQNSEGIRTPVGEAPAFHSQDSTELVSGEAQVLPEANPQVTPKRREASSRLTTQVRSANGEAITDGVAVWGARSDDSVFWRGELSALVRDHSQRLRTPIDDGQFLFEGHLDGTRTSIVHALALDHLAGAAAIDVDGDFPASMTLQPSNPIVVLVRGPDGTPVAGALVRSVGTIQIDETADSHIVHEDYVTGSDGRVSIYPLPGQSTLVAENGNETSEPWDGEHARQKEPIILELLPTFSVSGTVEGTLTGTDPSSYWVAASFEDESWRSVPLATLSVETNGSFSGRVPWIGEGSYAFRLYSRESRPFLVREHVPDPDSSVRISFNLSEGHEATFLLVDADKEPQANIPVAAVWNEEGKWLYYPAKSDEDGLVSFHGCPPKQMWVRTYSKRHVDKPYGPYMVSVETTVVLEIVLEPIGRIKGRVLLDGEPVENFRVIAWPEDPNERNEHKFSSPSGEFEILNAPLGLVHLAALTDSHPMGPVKLVTTTGEGVATVELELNEGVTGSGRVLDIANGKGIPGASIQVWTKFESTFMDEWNPPISTGADGRFEGLLLSPGGSALAITAEGFEQEIKFLTSTKETSILLGDIGLAKPQNLLVRLIGPAETDFAGYTVVVAQGTNRAPVAVDAMGEVLLEDVDSGICGIQVWTPDGERIAVNVDLISGRHWEVLIPVFTERTVVVNVEPESGKPLPDDLWVEASYLGPGGHTSSRVSPVEADGRSTFYCVSGDGAVFRAIDERGVYYASLWAALADAPLAEVTLRLSGKVSHLLLLDSDEKPVSGAFVMVMVPGDSLHDQFSATSDSAGMITLSEYGSDTIYLMVDTGQGILAVTPPIHLDVDEDPIRVHLDSSSMVAARLEEAGVPAVSVRADLAAPDVFAAFRTATSDGEGMVRFQGLSKTTYTLRVEGDGWWPAEYQLSASAEPPIQTLRVRRIGTLAVKITRLGLPLPKAELRLTSLLDDLDVRTWIESGHISTGPSGLVSDLKGNVIVQGLPAGPYRWTVLVPGLVPLQGQIEVRPLDETLLSVAVE